MDDAIVDITRNQNSFESVENSNINKLDDNFAFELSNGAVEGGVGVIEEGLNVEQRKEKAPKFVTAMQNYCNKILDRAG
jgi:hypothetical protein